MTELEYPIVNPADNDATYRTKLYLMWAGAYGTPRVYVWADSFDTAFEHLVEWLDDNAPGLLTKSAEFEPADCDDDGWPMDHTIIGHTTLENGDCIASWEWGGDEVTDASTIVAVRQTSLSE